MSWGEHRFCILHEVNPFEKFAVDVSFLFVKHHSFDLQVYWLQFGRYFARGPIVSSRYLVINIKLYN